MRRRPCPWNRKILPTDGPLGGTDARIQDAPTRLTLLLALLAVPAGGWRSIPFDTTTASVMQGLRAAEIAIVDVPALDGVGLCGLALALGGLWLWQLRSRRCRSA